MVDFALNEQLRGGREGVKEAIQQVQKRGRSAEWLTSYLLEAIESTSVPPAAFGAYLDLCRDPHAMRAGLEQNFSISVRETSIRHFVKLIRSKAEFRPAWDEVGGASGLAAMMREFSYVHVNILCHGLGNTGLVSGARVGRQQRLSELLRLLCGPRAGVPRPSDASPQEPDPRPLRQTYMLLVKSCTPEVCMEWHDEATRSRPQHNKRRGLSYPYRPEQLLYNFHPHAYQAQMIQQYFQSGDQRTPAVALSTILEAIDPLLAADRRFTMTALERAVELGPNRFNVRPKDLLSVLAFPLLIYFQKRKGTHSSKARVWSLIFTSYRKWPNLGDETHPPTWYLLLKHAILWWKWSSTPESRLDAQKNLESLFGLPSETQGFSFRFILQFLRQTRTKALQRYELLCMALQQQRRHQINIETPRESDKLRLKSIKDKVNSELFTQLPPDKALRFLELLMEIKPLGDFVAASNTDRSILSLLASPTPNANGLFDTDIDILRCFLRRQSLGSVQDAQEEVKSRMVKATQSRDWNGRAFWAKSAMFLSIASGSFPLYSQTLVWVRRFHRDHNTVAELYKADVLGTHEALQLLGGVPIKSRLHVRSLAEVREDISSGNNIISALLAGVADGLDEAGIKLSTWSYVTSGRMPSDVVLRRFKCVNSMQDYHELSDEEVFDLVWQPTIQMLVEVEAFALQEKHLKMNFTEKDGIIEITHGILEDIRDHGWKFFDQLARARDELWTRARIAQHPTVQSLGPPWPKGLPTHFLCRFNFGDRAQVLQLPYVLTRVKAVIFAHPEVALSLQPEVQEMQDAIGKFTEHYSTCLKIYLQACDKSQSDTRGMRSALAWRHATTELAGDRMSREEAQAFWRQWVTNWVWEKGESNEARSGGHLPYSTPTESVEGDISNEMEAGTKPRYLDPKCLDIMLLDSHSSLQISKLFEKRKWPEYTHVKPLKTNRKIKQGPKSPKTSEEKLKDISIATASQFVNAEYESDSALNTKPFPADDQDTPCPALYRTDGYIERTKTQFDDALTVLHQHHAIVPVDTLKRLINSSICRSVHPTEVVSLVQFLAKSDRPSVAFSLIRHIILDGPRYSTWHRQVFNTGLFGRLPAREAKTFLEGVGNAVAERLELSAKLSEPEPSDPAQSVKITTVKMLAEVIRTSKAIDVKTGTAVLMRIFLVAKHIDIRAAVIQSLLHAFDTAEEDGLRETIMSSLQRYAVYVAASLNERNPLSEEDWITAATDGKLPEIPQPTKNEELRPISKLLLEFPEQLQKRHPDWSKRWASEIILGILSQSITNNIQWLKLFLRVNGLTVPDGDLPVVPVDPGLYESILEKCKEFLDPETFHLFKRWGLFQISRPRSIIEVNESLATNPPATLTKNAKKHWDIICGLGGKGLNDLPVSVLTAVKVLEEQQDATSSDSLAIPSMQEYLFKVAEALITHYPQARTLWDKFTNALFGPVIDPTKKKTLRGYTAWKLHTRPVMEQIIALIESIKADTTWRAKDHSTRVSQLLPDLFPIRINMLPYPSTKFAGPNASAPKEEIILFCEQLYKLIDELAERAVLGGVPYHDGWKRLNDWVLQDPGWAIEGERPEGCVACRDFVRVAVRLWGVMQAEGQTEGKGVGEGAAWHGKLTWGLVFELVDELIGCADNPDGADDGEEVIRRAREMVDGWLESEKEVVRSAAMETVKLFRIDTKGAVYISRGSLGYSPDGWWS